MPFYQFLCLASAQLERPALGQLVTRTARLAMANGGVVTQLSPFGTPGIGPMPLAYRIRRDQKNHIRAYAFQMAAFLKPAAFLEIQRLIRLDESIVRHIAVKRDIDHALHPFPDPKQRLQDPTVDRDDPQYDLAQFVAEYAAQHPAGQAFAASADAVANQTATSREISQLLHSVSRKAKRDTRSTRPGDDRLDKMMDKITDSTRAKPE